MGRLVKTRTVAFRVDADEYRRIDGVARAEGRSANEWCRDLVLAGASGTRLLGAGERVFYEEIACLRYLLGHGLKLLASGKLTHESWEALAAQADRNAGRIARVLLDKRSGAGRSESEAGAGNQRKEPKE